LWFKILFVIFAWDNVLAIMAYPIILYPTLLLVGFLGLLVASGHTDIISQIFNLIMSLIQGNLGKLGFI